ncbi:MAG: polysaccharide biosynthesis C-terminal domain-containing protein [Candidatus Omnitrophota bacterium]|nr:polysaccharide biosynthesis C-terminal domain-containing protein [Candidatus Omnitrophota bacterium]
MSPKNSVRFAIFNAVYSYIGKAVSSVFTALAFVLIVRSLSVTDYGRYTFYINGVFFVAILLDLGMAELILRYAPQHLEEGNISTVKWMFKKSVLLISGACAGAILLSFIIMRFLPGLTSRLQLNKVLPFIIIFGWMRIIMLILGNVLNAFFKQSYRITCEIAISAVRLFFIYLLIKRGMDVWFLIVLFGALDLIMIAAFYAKIGAMFKSVSAKAGRDIFGKMRWFALNEYLYRLFWFFTDNRFDLYLVGLILGLTPAGYFAFAAGIVNLLIDWSPGLIIRPVLAPLFVQKYAAAKDISMIQNIFQLHNKFLIFLTLPIFAAIAVIIDKVIIYILDPKYLASLNVFFIFLGSMFLVNILIPLRNVIAMIERPDISNITNIVAIPKILLILWLAGSMGIIGVASIYALSLAAIILINVVLIKKEVELAFPWKSFFKIAGNSLVMAAVLFSLRPLIVNRINLFLILICGMGVYILAAYLNKAFDDRERALFNRAFKVKLWYF